ncbi:MAG: hypothetical protein AAFQ20_09545 [Bacteroidota bacterium]
MEHGGARPGAGRKTKDEEAKAKALTIKALITEYGSEEKAFEFAARKSKSDDKNAFAYFKLLVEYAYGKPKEEMSLNFNREVPLWTD